MAAGIAIGVAVTATQLAPSAPAAVPARTAFVISAGTSFTVGSAAASLPLAAPLVLPVGMTNVDLAAIPDRMLNDPPAARLRARVQVRSSSGLASVDAPFEIAWSESGYFYWLRSSTMSIAQLVDIASALR